MNLVLSFRVALFIFIATPQYAFSFDFNEAIENIKKHDIVIALQNKSKALIEEGKNKGSWGDPRLNLAAKNFPKNNLKDNETPMTGIEFGISQNVSLTTKYGNIKDAYAYLGKAKKHDSEAKTQELIKTFWEILIENKRRDEEVTIFEENLNWIKKILKVSKRLYANGKTSQQALLDIQIRKSELEASLSNKKFEAKEQQEQLSYILGYPNKSLSKESIPWIILEKKNKEQNDTKELSLKSNILAKSKILAAKKLAFIPDLTLSVGFTKRANIDKEGDFVSAMVTLPLPFSSKRYSDHSQAIFEKVSTEKQLKNYLRLKESESKRLNHQIERLKIELKILNERTIKFAENSRQITSKSYALGDSTYIELLQSELKLQKLLIKRSNLNAMLLKTQANYKYLIGDKLYE